MLFLGNSYTFVNELDVVVASVFEAAGEPLDEHARLAEGGWRFVDHLAAIETPGSDWDAAFQNPHDWVILQEQSQIPGFPPEASDEVGASRDAAVALDGHAAATGARTMFLMTWGRRSGDETNPDIYPDFPTMQARLADGYATYVELASVDGTQAWIAPAGLAWERVYDDVAATGTDPATAGTAFWDLYIDDGSHPSPRGTYLTACVIFASVTGESPEGLPAPDGIADAAYLQEVAAEVVLTGEGFAYPWEDGGGDSGDSGDGDSGAGDSGTAEDSGGNAGDSGPEDSGPAAEDSGRDADTTGEGPADDGPKVGCGCASAPGGEWGFVAGIGAVLVGRRRR
jgi:MYXO-CTERM domain-containing protein